MGAPEEAGRRGEHITIEPMAPRREDDDRTVVVVGLGLAAVSGAVAALSVERIVLKLIGG